MVVKNSKINAECTWEIEWKRESVKELGDRETGEQGSTVAEIQEKQYANKRNIKLFRLQSFDSVSSNNILGEFFSSRNIFSFLPFSQRESTF